VASSTIFIRHPAWPPAPQTTHGKLPSNCTKSPKCCRRSRRFAVRFPSSHAASTTPPPTSNAAASPRPLPAHPHPLNVPPPALVQTASCSVPEYFLPGSAAAPSAGISPASLGSNLFPALRCCSPLAPSPPISLPQSLRLSIAQLQHLRCVHQPQRLALQLAASTSARRSSLVLIAVLFKPDLLWRSQCRGTFLMGPGGDTIKEVQQRCRENF